MWTPRAGGLAGAVDGGAGEGGGLPVLCVQLPGGAWMEIGDAAAVGKRPARHN